MQSEIRTSLTFSNTLAPPSGGLSMVAQEEHLMEALNAMGRAGAKDLLESFDADGGHLAHGGRTQSSKGKVAKIYEAPWGEVMLERHLYQTSSVGWRDVPALSGARRQRTWREAWGTNTPKATRARWCAIYRRIMGASSRRRM